MKKLLSVLFILLVFSIPAYATNHTWGFDVLTGGGMGSLDKITPADGDMAIGIVGKVQYSYSFNSADSSSSNPPLIIKPVAGSGCWKLSWENTFNAKEVRPEWFGAIGDGNTDDTTAIQAAIDSLTTGGIVKLNIGTYIFSKLHFTHANVTLKGEGWNTILSSNMSQTATTDTVILIQADGIRLKDFKLQNTVLPTALYATGGTWLLSNNQITVGWPTVTTPHPVIENTIIDHVWVYGAKCDGIVFAKTKNSQLINSRIEEVWATGVWAWGAVDLKIDGNYLYRTADTAIDPNASGATSGGDGDYCDNVVISNNIIENTGVGIGLHGTRNVSVTGNVIRNTWAQPLGSIEATGDYDSSYVTSITGNAIYQIAQWYGTGTMHPLDYVTTMGASWLPLIWLDTKSEIVFANNTIYDDGSQSHLYTLMSIAGKKVSITGNVAKTGFGKGILIGKWGVPSDYTWVDSVAVTGNDITITSSNGEGMLDIFSVARGVVSGNNFDCGTTGKFALVWYAKDVLITGNNVINYTYAYTTNGYSSGIVMNNNLGIKDTSIKPIYQPAIPTYSAATLLTIGDLLCGVISADNSSGALEEWTLPTGTNIEAGVNLQIDEGFDWTIVNMSTLEADYIQVVANTDSYVSALGVVNAYKIYGATNYMGTFRTVKRAVGVYTTYRVK